MLIHTTYSFNLGHIFNSITFCSSGQQNAANVSLEVVKELPRLQEREQSRGGRFGGGGRGFSGGGNRFSGGRGGGNRFSGGRGGRGNGGRGGRRW